MRTATKTVERSKAEALGARAALASCLPTTEAAGKSRVSAQHSTDLATGLFIKDGDLLDPAGEYGSLISALGGANIRLAPGADTILNPFDTSAVSDRSDATKLANRTDAILALSSAL